MNFEDCFKKVFLNLNINWRASLDWIYKELNELDCDDGIVSLVDIQNKHKVKYKIYIKNYFDEDEDLSSKDLNLISVQLDGITIYQ